MPALTTAATEARNHSQDLPVSCCTEVTQSHYLPTSHISSSLVFTLTAPMLARSSSAAVFRQNPPLHQMQRQSPKFGALWLRTASHRRRHISTATATATASVLPEGPSASSTAARDVESGQGSAEYQKWTRQVLRDAVAAAAPRYTWSREEIAAIYHQPLMELAYQAVRI